MALAEFAAQHGATPMLAAAVADAPELERRLPDDFASYLRLVRLENAARNLALRRQVLEAGAAQPRPAPPLPRLPLSLS